MDKLSEIGIRVLDNEKVTISRGAEALIYMDYGLISGIIRI